MSAAGQLHPGARLSLWDIMKKLNANFIGAYQRLATFLQAIQESHPSRMLCLKNDFHTYKQLARLLSDQLSEFGLNPCAVCFNRAIEVMDRAQDGLGNGHQVAILTESDAAKLINHLKQGITRVEDELSQQIILIIDPKDIELFEQTKPLFGDMVFNAFPSANEDIEEAGKCLSLERATASVMHLNRALEVCLKALAKAVGISSQNDWGSYVREIEKELEKRKKTSGARSTDEQFYAEAAANFDSLKRAYRNPTMHPEKTYSTERAEEILLATKSFMSHLAARIKE